MNNCKPGCGKPASAAYFHARGCLNDGPTPRPEPPAPRNGLKQKFLAAMSQHVVLCNAAGLMVIESLAHEWADAAHAAGLAAGRDAKKIERLIESLPWTAQATDYDKMLVVGNLLHDAAMILYEEVNKAMREAAVGQDGGAIRKRAVSVCVEMVERERAEMQELVRLAQETNRGANERCAQYASDRQDAEKRAEAAEIKCDGLEMARVAWERKAKAAEAALAERGHEHTATCFTHPLTGLVSVRARCAPGG